MDTISSRYPCFKDNNQNVSKQPKDKKSQRRCITESLQKMKKDHLDHERIIIQKEKHKIDILVKSLSCRQGQQLIVEPRCVSVQKPPPVQQLPNEITLLDTPGLMRLFHCKVTTGWKPSHRYKTYMVENNGKLYLFGGLGCQKLLTWGTFDISLKQWDKIEIEDSIQNLQNRPRFPRYSHSLVAYKNKLIVYGGFMLEICSDVTIFDVDKLSYFSGARGPARRDHAVTTISKYMIVHGGIQQGNLICHQFHVYNMEIDAWYQLKLVGNDKIFLSHHKMVSTWKKGKKLGRFDNPFTEDIYMFGGKNSQGQSVSDFYRIRIQGTNVRMQKIKTKRTPQPRYQHCLEYIQTGYLVLHGGRTHQQLNTKRTYNGVYQDFYLYDISRNTWYQPVLQGYPTTVRYGMASTVVGSSIYIFGGCNASHFCDGQIYQIESDPTKIPKLQQQMHRQIKEIEMVESGDHRLKSTITKILKSGRAKLLEKIR